jgi:GntR family transcriptional regulator, transcriptional repressor for pyruvate dehydrogenase complex
VKPFSKVERKRLSEQVADAIEDAILSGTVNIGSTLPSEQRLAEQFGVSRNVVREAFKFLQERGLIDILNGSGAVVSQPNAGLTSNALGRYLRLIGAYESVDGLYEARRILEGSNARLAAQRADEQDLATLEECLTRMRDHAGSIERWSQADLEFHLAVAKATHNPFLSVLLEPLVDQLRDVIAEGYRMPGAVGKGLDAHNRLYECIKKRDAEGAYTVIMEHLHDSEARFRNAVAKLSSEQSKETQSTT